MKSTKKVIIINLLIVLYEINVCTMFSYDRQMEWTGACHGERQSPIELNVTSTFETKYVPKITYFNYNTLLSSPILIRNNGHSVEIKSLKTTDEKPFIVSIIFPGEAFVFESFHFHWGSNSHGSEHTINGIRFGMEMHIIHRNLKYATLNEALKHKNGLVVIGILFHITDNNFYYNYGIEKITNKLTRVTKYNSKFLSDDLFALDDLIGSISRNQFYWYHGSLTTPPCAQVVTWIVLDEPNVITNSQMEFFRQLQDHSGNQILDNFRQLQHIGKRNVFYRRNLN